MFNLNKSHEGEANSAGRRGQQGKEKIQDVRGEAEFVNSVFTNEEIKIIFNQIFSAHSSRTYFFELLQIWRQDFRKKFDKESEQWLQNKSACIKKIG